MKWFILMISTLAVVHTRPENSRQKKEPSVELEKQTIIEVNPDYGNLGAHPTQRKIEESTKEILEKIAEVNKKQGLERRKQTPSYFHFPFDYSRSQDKENESHDRPHNSFIFSNNPFSNPIFEYLERERHEDDSIKPNDGLTTNEELETDDQPQFYEKSITNAPTPGLTKEDIIPGQFVKRKVVHQQTILMPNPNLLPPLLNSMIPQTMPSYVMDSPPNLQQIISDQSLPLTNNENKEQTNKTSGKKNYSNLEEQTVDNIRNIVSNTQMSQNYPIFYNPYTQYYQGNIPYQYPYGLGAPYDSMIQQPTNYRQYTTPNTEKGRQNWNWPGASYFPIYIRDPFLQLYNAVTSMIEYGPTAGQGNPCKRPRKKGGDESLIREAKIANEPNDREIVLEIGKETSPQITIYGVDGDSSDKNSQNYLDIENIDIGADKDSSLKFTVNLKSTERGGKEDANKKPTKTWDKINSISKAGTNYSASRSTSKLEKFPSESTKDFIPPFLRPQPKPSTNAPPKQPVVSSPIKDSTPHKVEIIEEFDEDEKADDISISNDGNKKLFSKDNTGSGIFIHKLKVRKGGVAIAGPGGIATAGSGGTAIVGPNGVAYTHPDSLAIAGSGAKIVAVDPTINLGDLISNATRNKPSAEGFPPSRVGKVVAVGPVVYYNRG